MKRNSPHRQSFSIATDGQGIVNHAGAAALRELADRFGYTSTLCDGLDPLRARRATHHPGAVPTASRVISRLTRGHLEQLRAARRRMRDQVWRKAGRPELLVLDIDATLVTSHSEKEEASGNYKHGFGFHPLACFLEATGDALSALLRGGSAGSNTARDHIEVFRLGCDQLPEWVQEEPMLVRCDSAGASHDFLNAVRAREKAKFWVGFELREEVREAILKVPEEAWEAAIRQTARIARAPRSASSTSSTSVAGRRAPAPSAAESVRTRELSSPSPITRAGVSRSSSPTRRKRTPSPRPLRGPDPMCQGDRAPRLPLPGLRAEPDLARVGARRSRPALPLPPRRPHR